MSEVKALFGKFLEIQKEQNELLKSIAQCENMQHLREHALERIGGSCDPHLLIESRAINNQELVKFNQKYQKNQARIEELRKQLFAEVF